MPSQQRLLLTGSGGLQRSPPTTLVVPSAESYGSLVLNVKPGLSLAAGGGAQAVGFVGAQPVPMQRQTFGLVSPAPLAVATPQTTLLTASPPQQQQAFSLQDALLALQARHVRAAEQQAAGRYM